jgi:hypothetical protein
MIRTTIHVVILFVTASSLMAEGFLEAEDGLPPNHLEPVGPDFDSYRKKIAKKLLLTPADHGLMICRPSFTGESAISVYEKISDEVLAKHDNIAVLVPNEEKSFFITYTKAKESLWFSMAEINQEKKEKEVEVQRKDLEISSSLAMAIQRAWGRMLIRTKYPEKSYRGLDGTTYEFAVFVRGLGYLQGETWEPGAALPSKIQGLGVKLRQVAAEGKPLTKKQEEELIKELSDFERLANKP